MPKGMVLGRLGMTMGFNFKDFGLKMGMGFIVTSRDGV